MSHHYEIDKKLGAAIWKLEGIITDEESIAATKRFFADPNYTPEIRMLWDYTGVTENKLTYNGLQAIAHHAPKNASGRRAALVRDGLDFGTSRQYEGLRYTTLQKNLQGVFTARQDALNWLNGGMAPEMHMH